MRKLILALLALLVLPGLMSGCQKRQQAPAVRTVGKPAPDFTLEDMNGKTWHLADLKGKVVFVNFWATWCPPCRGEMPSLENLYQSMPADRFQMLTILSNDKPEEAAHFTKLIHFTAPVLLDPDHQGYRAYGLTGVPET